ncbi:hypothetical protein ACRAJ3_01775 [Rhodococcus pyridinivorans]|uniref:hypothetical protein n=1 Tax=Rhodococcus pyridinivorans TaxID=103816 RepID=UPI0034427B18
MVELLEQPRDLGNQQRRASLVARTVGTVLAERPERGDVHDIIALVTASTQVESTSSLQPDEWVRMMNLLANVLRGYQERISHSDESERPQTTISERILAALVVGPCTPKKMARQVGSPLTSITRVLRGLESDGLVKLSTQVSPDKREKPRELTEKGWSKLIECGVLKGEVDQIRSDSEAHKSAESQVVERQLNHAIRLRRAVRPDLNSVNILKSSLSQQLDADLRSQILGELLATSRDSVEFVSVSEGVNYLTELLKLSETQSDRVKARALYELARWLHGGRPFASQLTTKEALGGALALAISSGDFLRAGWCKFFDGIMRNATEDLDGAQNSLLAAVEFFQKANDDYGLVSAYALIAKVYFAEANYPQAVEYLNSAQDIATREGLQNDVAQIKLWLGELYMRLSPRSSYSAFLDAAKMYRGLDDTKRVFIALSGAETARFLCRNEALSDSVDVNVGRLQRAIQYVESDSSLMWWKGAMLHRAGVVERELGMKKSAIEHLQEAVELYRSTKDQRLASGLASLAILVHNTGQEDERHAGLVKFLQEQVPTAMSAIQRSYFKDEECCSWYESALGVPGGFSKIKKSLRRRDELRIELSSCR